VEAIGWSRFFGRVVGAGDAAIDKPHAAPVALALEPSGIGAGEAVWFVGDNGVDMECAHNSGCVPVLLGAGLSEAESGRCPPRHLCADADTLFRLLRDL
jgi:phosphoglycolate phosphatase